MGGSRVLGLESISLCIKKAKSLRFRVQQSSVEFRVGRLCARFWGLSAFRSYRARCLGNSSVIASLFGTDRFNVFKIAPNPCAVCP